MKSINYTNTMSLASEEMSICRNNICPNRGFFVKIGYCLSEIAVETRQAVNHQCRIQIVPDSLPPDVPFYKVIIPVSLASLLPHFLSSFRLSRSLPSFSPFPFNFVFGVDSEQRSIPLAPFAILWCIPRFPTNTPLSLSSAPFHPFFYYLLRSLKSISPSNNGKVNMA